ncbi:MAG: cupin domain-containing protein [Thermomicrobiales bacterium]|nr:cupin domain-containing protein [Thermomicrobiales bacterium]
MSGQPDVVFRPGGTGPATWAMGSLFERLALPSETQGLDVALVTQPPGIATPLHRHTHESEAFFIIEGQMTYRAGDDVYRLTAGDFIYLPAGVPHAFRVTGTTPVRFIGFANPGGLFDLYDEVGIPAVERRLPGADGQPMDVEVAKWDAVGPRYGLEVVGPPLADDA